jgi:hypothetical protein
MLCVLGTDSELIVEDLRLDKIHYRVRNTNNGRAMAKELVSFNGERILTLEQYRDLADVPPELEWLANITNPKTRRAYEIADRLRYF